MTNADALLTPPNICGFAEVELAHAQMRQHCVCRIERCAWKRAAYYTLVRHGRITPPKLSPRERAHMRGIEFPKVTINFYLPEGMPELQTFQDVLDGLAQLALPTNPGNGCGRAHGKWCTASSRSSAAARSRWSWWRVYGRSTSRAAIRPDVAADYARSNGRRRGRAAHPINRSPSLTPMSRCSCTASTTARASTPRSMRWSRPDVSTAIRHDDTGSGANLGESARKA